MLRSRSHADVLAVSLAGAVFCGSAASLVVIIPMLADDPLALFLVTFMLASAAFMSLWNALYWGGKQYAMYRRTRASRRAQKLLLRLLTPSQRDQYLAGTPIIVPVTDGHGAAIGEAHIGGGISGVAWYHYRSVITPSALPRWWYFGGLSPTANIPAQPVHQCVNIDDGLCPEDKLIALLLWLRADPEGLVAVSTGAPGRLRVADYGQYGYYGVTFGRDDITTM